MAWKPKKIHPPKPPDRIQNIRTIRPIGKNEWVKAHWLWNYETNKWEWVEGHWRK